MLRLYVSSLRKGSVMYVKMMQYRLARPSYCECDFSTDIDASVIEEIKKQRDFSLEKKYGSYVLRSLNVDWLPTLTELAEELQSDMQSFGTGRKYSDCELLAVVMSRGVINDSYGDTYWGRTTDTLHLLTCGIDWSRFYGVRDTSWNSFDGTFSEGRNTRVLGANLRCRCDDEIEVYFGIEPPSVATLFAALSTDTLEKIFE